MLLGQLASYLGEEKTPIISLKNIPDALNIKNKAQKY